MKGRLDRAIDRLQPQDAADRARLKAWLRTIAEEYFELRTWIADQPAPGRLRDELLEVAKAAGHLADMIEGLSDAAVGLLRDPFTFAGAEFDRDREFLGESYEAPAAQVRSIGLRACEESGRGWPIVLRALAELCHRSAERNPVSRQLGREQVARRDPYRDLVVASGNVIFSRGIEVRATPLAELSLAIHEESGGSSLVGDETPVLDARVKKELRVRAERYAPRFELLRDLEEQQIAAAAGRPITVTSPGSEFFGPISELRRELQLNIGVDPEDDQ